MSAGQATQNQQFPATTAPTTLVGAGYELMKGQPFNNLLTAALLAAIIATGYGAYLAIPVHLKTIQDGYERIEAIHERDSSAARTEFANTIKQLTAAIKDDRDLDRKHQREMLDLIIQNKLGSTQ
jgi:hypothetical protein